VPRPPFPVVVILLVAPFLFAAHAAVGLLSLSRLTDRLRAETPAPPPAPVSCDSAAPAPAIAAPPTPPATPVRVLAVREDAVEIDAGGVRHQLRGYPPMREPSSRDPDRLTAAVIAATGELAAIGGDCHHGPGTAAPACTRVFVRVYRVADGAHVRDLAVPWAEDTARRRLLALAFDERAERVAALVTTWWTDCDWEGDVVELFVFRVSDGARITRRTLATKDTGGTRTLTFLEHEVHVQTTRPRGLSTLRIVQLGRAARPAAR
jgi:hypothetical protein